MGTINYKTSDYITLGIKPYDREDFINDPECMEAAIRESIESDISIRHYIDDLIGSYYEADKENAECFISKYDFRYFSLSVEPGYYEGLYVDLSEEFPLFIDDEDERKEILQEIETLKSVLIDIAGCGFVACFPGWSTGYSDYNGTLKEIETACNYLKENAMERKPWEVL